MREDVQPYPNLPCCQLCQPLDSKSIQAALIYLSIFILEVDGRLGFVETNVTAS